MYLDKIYIMKEDNTTGYASIKYIDDDKDSLIFGGIVIDLSDTITPVQSLKVSGQDVIKGNIFNALIPIILDSFLEIKDEPNGLYAIDEETISKE